MNPLARRCIVAVVALALAIAVSSSRALLEARGQLSPNPAEVADISSEALAQIEALISEKASRNGADRKLDSQLVYELKMAQGDAIAPGVQDLSTDLPYSDSYRLVLDLKADVSDALLEQLRAIGAEIDRVDAGAGTLRVQADLDQVQAIAALPAVHFVQPKQQAVTSSSGPGQGSTVSEGELTHRAFAARGAFHADGTGVKIGVLSDGVSNLAASQTLGDLGLVTVLPGQAGSGDEGTAMLEIIHDLAPGAQLYFATAFNGISSFANNIRALRAAGCDIIVDDVFYYVESPFQDGQTPGVVSNTNGGAVTQAVKDVTAAGALYFSSAGNSGNKNDGTSGTWEGDFADGGAVTLGSTGYRIHKFGAQTYNVISWTGSVTNLSWADPLGGSANDYDLFLLNSAGTSVLASSTNVQSGTQDPYEQVSAGSFGNRLVVVKSAAAGGRFLHLDTNRGRLSISTAGQTHGHAATNSVGAFGVAATPASASYPAAFAGSNVVESFSSDGPRRIFFQADGTAITSGDFSSNGGQSLTKPDLTAADGVSVTGVGDFSNPFYGTSAAAPHAAAIAALIKSANLALTSTQIRTALASTAIDIEAPGVDRDSGAGIVMAYNALQTVTTGTAFLASGTVVASENPGNSNSVINSGEGAKVIVPLTNLGVTGATGISATLTTSTPGVTMLLPGQSAYPDLAVGASAPNVTPFFFTMAANAACPLTIDFTLTLSYAGGPSPAVVTFRVSTGPPPITITTTLDALAPVATTAVTPSTGLQVGRLWRTGQASTCAAPTPVPSLYSASGSRRFEAFSINTCSESVASCATVSISGGASEDMFSAAYIPAFNVANLQYNYVADLGSSGPGSYSFSLPGGSQTVGVAVHEVDPGSGVGGAYTLTVAGACAGACATPNQIPVARVRNVTLAAALDGTASGSIDNGSSDADGDVLTITQSPAGPYALGTTSVRLTVVDPKGAASQATANVTVTTLPVITTQPQNQIIPSGTTATMSVVAGSAVPLSYQWYAGASGTTTAPVTGATSSHFTTPVLTTAASYWVRANNTYGTADSAAAAITIGVPPAITTQPQSTPIGAAQRATLSVAATGTPPLSYQWYVGNSGVTTSPVGGAGASTLTTPSLTNTTRYWVRVSSPYGTVDSSVAVVSTPPTITTPNPWPAATAASAYAVTLTATNSIAPFQWSATALPSGLTLNASTGAVTGTPNGAGTFGFIIRATGADALFTDQTFSLSVGAVADTLLAQQWHLEDSGVEMAGANVRPAWPTSRGAGVVIGIVDDGVQWTHPDLQANYDVTLSHDYDGHDHDASPRTSGACGATADCRGTSAAGIAAARSDNGVGGSGVAPLAAIAGIRLGENAADADVASAISHQLSGIHVENHSWLRPDDGQTLAAPGPLAEAALTNAIAQGRAGAGRVFVWAAGDGRAVGDNCNFDGYANSRFGIAVGAVDETGRQAPYSESCSALLVSAPSSGAPGVHRGLTTTDLLGSDGNSAGDYTSAFGGTSAAAPVVSGVAALMLARNPALTWRDVQHILVRSGRQVDAADPGWTAGVFPHSERYGFGIVDALAAVTRAGTWTNVAAESAVPPIARAVGTTIPDNDATGVSDSVSVGPEYAGFSIEHVEVEFNATHPHRGDLEVTLISPSGDVSHLGTVRPADAAANFTGWRFRSVRHWGQSPVGTWRLQVADRAAGGTGIWNAWTLRIHGLAPPPPAPVPPSGGGSSGGGGGGGSAPAPPAADPAPSGLGAPVGLSGTVSGTTVVLSWAPPATGVTPTTYILEAGSAPGASNVIVYNTGSAATSYTATGVGAGIYYVRVRASHGGTTGVASNEITFRIGAGAIPPSAGGPPGPPLGLAARTSGSNLTLSWSVPALGARPTTYIVEAGSGPGRSDLATFSTGNAVPSLSAPGLGAGTYFVRVRAANSAGVSAPSNEVVFAVGGAPVPTACSVAPGAPGGLRSSVHGSTVTLEWNAASGGPTSYVVEAGSSSGLADLVVSDTGNAGTSLVATGVGAGSYFVRMRAHNGCGAGAASNEVIVVVR